MSKLCASIVITWAAGLVAGLLIRSSAGQHGLLPSLAIVVVSAGAAGAIFALTAGSRS